jgi:hypothetical protein
MCHHCITKRGPIISSYGPRFYFLLGLISSYAFGQQDSVTVFHLSAQTSYSDIFRQSSDRSRTVVFSSASSFSLSAAKNEDSLSVSYLSSTNYASVGQQQSRFTASLLHIRRDIVVSYNSTLSLLHYGISAGIPVTAEHASPRYGLVLSASPFNSFVNASISLQRNPARYTSGIAFHDFIVPFRDDLNSMSTTYTISISPLSALRTTILYDEVSGDRPALAEGYGMWTQFRSIGKELSGSYSLSQDMIIRISGATSEHRMNLTMKEHALTFGDLSNGSLRMTKYTSGLRVLPLGLSAEYSFEQFSLSGVGEIESWPFTSLASSIISNRLNYTLTGTFKHHALGISSNILSGPAPITASISYHHILADAMLEHWEPEFLVFGRKNFITDPFTISDLQLLGLSITAMIPFGGTDISLFADQYIPFSIRYRSAAAGTGQVPTPTTTAPSRSVTDGGRRAGISLSLPL